MSQSITSLINTGTKLWLDSVDPSLVQANYLLGVTGATSNPIIIADLIKSGRFDKKIEAYAQQNCSPEEIAWNITNDLVQEAEEIFKPIFEKTRGEDGYVSFELDPLLEDLNSPLSMSEKVNRYIELGLKWSKGHPNRMIKVPATVAGLASLESLAAQGVPVNVTLIFSKRQYTAARDAIWRGIQKCSNKKYCKSVYSIFVSRIDVYTAQKYPNLSKQAQGMAGILNAKLLWQENKEFWQTTSLPLKQEIIFASTGTKNPQDKPWRYVEALAGSDIQTNPPATNDAIANNSVTFKKKLAEFPEAKIIQELKTILEQPSLEEDLMREGLTKFADPQKALIALIQQKTSR